LLLAVTGHAEHEGGAVKLCESVQAASAEKTAVTAQASPSDGSPVSVYVSGLAKGALNTWVPVPQLLETVSVPVAGELENVTSPKTE